jgi:hypothetical protein
MGHVRCPALGGRVVQKYFTFTQAQGSRNTATWEWGTDATTCLAVLVGEAIASFQRTVLKKKLTAGPSHDADKKAPLSAAVGFRTPAPCSGKV